MTTAKQKREKPTKVETKVPSIEEEIISRHMEVKEQFHSITEEKEDLDDDEEDDEAADEIEEAPPPIYRDNFMIVSDAFDYKHVKGIDLPKVIFDRTVKHKSQVVFEKSVVLIYLNVTAANVADGCFAKLWKSSSKGEITLKVVWVDPNTGTESSVWKFAGARIQALDFGNAAYQRPDINAITVQVEYDCLDIDNLTI